MQFVKYAGKSNIYIVSDVSNVSNMSGVSNMSAMYDVWNLSYVPRVSNVSNISGVSNISNVWNMSDMSKVSDVFNMYTATVHNVKMTNNLVSCGQWHQILCNIAKIPKMVAAHIDPMDLEPSARDQKLKVENVMVYLTSYNLGTKK